MRVKGYVLRATGYVPYIVFRSTCIVIGLHDGKIKRATRNLYLAFKLFDLIQMRLQFLLLFLQAGVFGLYLRDDLLRCFV